MGKQKPGILEKPYTCHYCGAIINYEADIHFVSFIALSEDSIKLKATLCTDCTEQLVQSVRNWGLK